MTRFGMVALSTGVTLAAGIAVAIAGTPFGGDDQGTIPSDAPNGPVTTCERGFAKAAGKLVSSLIKCHRGRVTEKFTNDTDEELFCEDPAVSKFAEGPNVTGCAPCTDRPPLGLGFGIEEAVDSFNNQVYCDNTGTPFGGDDSGFIPPDAPKGPETACSKRVGKNIGKLVQSIIKCHISRAAGKLADDTAEDTCEGRAITKFSTTKTAGCPACVNLASIAATAESNSDGLLNAFIWCGSPSGAFLQ
jgi:hypothetical protein